MTFPAESRSSPRGKRGWIVGLAIGVLAVGLVGCSFQRGSDASGGPLSSTAPIASAEGLSFTDRPTFAPTKADVDGLYAKYSAALGGDGIYDYVPRTADGVGYAHDFVAALGDLKGALGFMEVGSDSTSASELDAQIHAVGAQATELERRFLAGEDLDVTVQITGLDGTVSAPDGAGAGVVADTEGFARSFRGTPDADGSYAASAGELALEFGLALDYDYTSVYAHCMSSGGSTATIVASYCIATPDRIYVNTGYAGYPDDLRSPAFVSFIKHELSHYLIGQICDTSAPPIAGSANEGVTNSFAVLFLGADRSVLAGAAADFPDYVMSGATDAVARQIHDQRRCN